MLVALLAGQFGLLGCGALGWQTRPSPPPRVTPPPIAEPATPGSLWHPDLGANYQFVDVRPRFPGDLLTIVVAENARGKKDAETNASSDSSVAGSIEEFFGLPQKLEDIDDDINSAALVKAEAARSFTGSGETSRTGTLTGQITVTVTAVEPNGNLHVEGQKIVTINAEEQYMVLTGVVRPEDIDGTNTVSSSRLADARIDFYGSGVVANKQRPGFAFTLLDWLWPF
jgi:flagellar L-ring protein precursor FlgH